MRNAVILSILALSLSAFAAKIPPPMHPDSKPGPCSGGGPCLPVCPPNDPNGCGIYD